MKNAVTDELNRITASIQEARSPGEKIQAYTAARGKMLSLANSAPIGSERRAYAIKMMDLFEKKCKEMRFLKPEPIISDASEGNSSIASSGKRKEVSDEEDISSLVDVYQPQDIPDDRQLKDLQIHDKDKANLTKRIINPLKYPQEMNAAGIYPASYILYGPPGTGKTTLGQVIARESDSILVVVNGASIKGRYYGQSQSRLNQIIKYVNELAKTSNHGVVLLFDDCDALLGKAYHSAQKDIIAAFLTGFDGVGHKAAGRPFSVIFTTNKPDAFEENVVRRLGSMMYIGPPNAAQRRKYLESQIGKLTNISPDIDLNQLAQRTKGYSCADLNRLLDEANAEREDDSVVPPRFLTLCNNHLEAALKKTIPTLRDSVVAPYIKFAEERGLNVPDYD